jgi:hypothetical protein|tara:strand:+ start:2955 stop:3137 length:183 start_codon:yes stop_codon:yes gene_type:complete
MWSVEKVDGKPRAMFAEPEAAKASRQPDEYVVEYTFELVGSEPVVYPEVLSLDLDLGGEE